LFTLTFCHEIITVIQHFIIEWTGSLMDSIDFTIYLMNEIFLSKFLLYYKI
jgi:hypothetical protein